MAKRVSMDFAQAIGARLAELRKGHKLHQRDMALKMGISERVYRRYEGGEMVPGSDKLTALIEDMNDVNSTWLLTGTGRMFKSLGQPQLKEMILDIVASNPTIERIVILLKGLDDEDLKEILSRVSEKKRLKDLHTELRDMMKKLEKPVPEGSQEGRAG
jgi:transcriptional regulator with XRE-family HTH domain